MGGVAARLEVDGLSDVVVTVVGMSFDDGQERREHNRAMVDKYLHSGHGDALLHRHELFCEDGISGLWTSDSGEPVFAQGRENIAKYDVWSSEHFPDWA